MDSPSPEELHSFIPREHAPPAAQLDTSLPLGLLIAYSCIVCLLALLAEHLDLSIPVSTWASLATIGLAFTGLYAGHCWEKLSQPRMLKYPNRTLVLVCILRNGMFWLCMTIRSFWLLWYAGGDYALQVQGGDLPSRQLDMLLVLTSSIQLLVNVPSMCTLLNVNGAASTQQQHAQ